MAPLDRPADVEQPARILLKPVTHSMFASTSRIWIVRMSKFRRIVSGLRRHLWIVCLVVALVLYFLGMVFVDDLLRHTNAGPTFIAGSVAMLAAAVASRGPSDSK
jgi:hypothetical protein